MIEHLEKLDLLLYVTKNDNFIKSCKENIVWNMACKIFQSKFEYLFEKNDLYFFNRNNHTVM